MRGGAQRGVLGREDGDSGVETLDDDARSDKSDRSDLLADVRGGNHWGLAIG
jgi:hypothetical protein